MVEMLSFISLENSDFRFATFALVQGLASLLLSSRSQQSTLEGTLNIELGSVEMLKIETYFAVLVWEGFILENQWIGDLSASELQGHCSLASELRKAQQW